MNEDGFWDDLDFRLANPDKGRILISEPTLPDPNFSRTVILLTEHNSEGSVGFVLNRKSDMNLNEIYDDFGASDVPVYIGGPVGANRLFFIHTLGPELDHTIEVMKGLYWGGDFKQIEYMLSNGLAKRSQVRFFVGYSGWSVGQLEVEIEQNSWIVSKTSVQQVMSDSEHFWERVIRGLGKRFEVLSNFPINPNLN